VKRSLALFDFDGTVTSRDTMLEFIQHSRGWFGFVLGCIVLSPALIGMKLKLLPNSKVKEWMLRIFFSGKTLESFDESCHNFHKTRLPALVRENALKEILAHKRNGTRVVIVTASAENWIKRWVDEHNIELIATKLETANGRITGNICGRNCNGIEKVERIREQINLSEYKYIYAYGDSPGDMEMLKIATHSYYKPFR
jgi:HAD superfamily hydrolase (TIGR01490 family)